jgi:hypothetical protein
MTPARLVAASAAAVLSVSLATVGGSPATAAPVPGGPTEQLAQKIGMQTVPKGAAAKLKKSTAAAPVNPLLSIVPDSSKIDYAYWKGVTEQKSKARAAAAAKARAATKAAVEPLLVDEQEPDAVRGGNDTTANAQLIPQFGTGSGKRPAARILGTLAPPPAPATLPAVPEDNGSIPLAGETGLTNGRSVSTSGTIGDGPHGSAGDGTGDFDFYAVRGVAAGSRIVADITTPAGSELDSMLILYNAAGEEVAFNDDEDFGILDSLLTARVPAAGDYFLAVAGFPNLPADPNDSGSGDGAGAEGAYGLTIGLNNTDVDYYAVNLRPGDVLSGSVTGAGTSLQVFDTAGTEVFGSTQDASSIYPANTPLTGGGNAVVDHVVKKAGKYYVAVGGGSGNYDVTLEAYRSGPLRTGATQTIFLDFDGARVNTGIFGGPGVRTLSPFSAFLGRWGIPASQQNAVINRVIATVTENLKTDFSGTNIRILNSRDNADPFGQANVSRLIIGGTIEESGIETIGIAQSIDPGNYETEETALILLDVVSGDVDEWGDASFNYYITPASDKVKFVGTALGNIASHEAGHYLGNWHVDQFNDVLNLMDQGGNFPLLYAVGPDGIGGTADDPDVDFGPDTLNPNEGFTGIEDTYTRVKYALARAS